MEAVFHVKQSGEVVKSQRVVAIANQKGGVGKTTTAINLGAALATWEQSVLLVDLDPQSNCSSGVGVDRTEPSTYELIEGAVEARDAIAPTRFPNLHLIPARADLVGAEVELLGEEDRAERLRRALATVDERYDWIIVDCPPSLGVLTLNALVAAQSVLIPIQCEYFALEGVSELVKTLDRVRAAWNPELAIEGVVMTLFDERLSLARQVVDEVRQFFGEAVYDTVIPRNVRLAEAPSFGQTILEYDIRSRGASSYLDLAGEMLRRRRKNEEVAAG